MEFQEGMKVMIHTPIHTKKVCHKETDAISSDKSGKQKWKISLYRSSSSTTKPQKKQTPEEFTCLISGSLMADPVIVASGHTFERTCVEACKKLGYTPTLVDGTSPDFSNLIPNLALKSAIFNFCGRWSIERPKPLDFHSAESLVRTQMASQIQKAKANEGTVKEDKNGVVLEETKLVNGVSKIPAANLNHAATEVTRRPTFHFRTSSEESVASTSTTTPLPLATRPSCYSSSDSSEIENASPNSEEEEDLINKLKSSQVYDIEEAAISLRKLTRTSEDARVSLCTSRILSALRSLIISRYSNIQVHSIAALVNLSLEKVNKVKIVRSGIVPLVIDVLKGGFPEAQEHASGVLFSLALDDDNKTAIGVLGALQPLLYTLRSDSERTRNDSALALYHLSLIQSNRTKLVKLGAVLYLLGMVKSGHMTGRVMLILCNLAACLEGRMAMLDGGAVDCLVEILRGKELNSVATRESCVAALYGLSQGGLRFKGLAKEAGAVEVLRKVEAIGSGRAREKAKRILEMMKARNEEEEEEENDWEELIESGLAGRNRARLGCGLDGSVVNSSEF